jgi:hypothetical protein
VQDRPAVPVAAAARRHCPAPCRANSGCPRRLALDGSRRASSDILSRYSHVVDQGRSIL